MSPSLPKRVREDEATDALIEVIRLAAPGVDDHELMRSILQHVRNWLGCQAAGIRLRAGDDYPYFEVRGFPAEFVRLENSLCARGPDGAPSRDSTGSPVLDCMCGNVLSSRFDPEKPFFTPAGSFWSNNTTLLLASTSEAERLTRTRNRCNGEGYESVALVPLRTGGEGGEIIGLLQLCDKRPNRFTSEIIAAVEKVAGGIAVVLAERQAREALRIAEEKHRAVFEQSLDGIFLATPGGTVLEANPAACAMFGMAEQEIRGARREDLVVMDDAAAERLAERDRAGKTNGEVTFVRKDGTHFRVEFTSVVFRGDGGSGRSIVTFRDITERRRTEEALRQSERDLLEAQELAHIGNYQLDLLTQQLSWSEGMFRVWGLDPTVDVSRDSIREWMHPQDYERLERVALEAIEHGTPYELEFRIRHSNGVERTIVTTGMIERDATGRAVRLKGTHQDTTELRRAEEDYRTLFREMLDGFALHEIVCDEDGRPVDFRYVAVNPAFERLIGIKAEDVVGRTILEVEPDVDRHWLEMCVGVALTGTPAVIEDYQGPGGKHFQVTAFQPAPRQFAAIISDITERKQAEEALQGSESKMRGILDNLRVGVALLSPKMEVLELNPVMRRWFPGIDLRQQPLCYQVFNDPPREAACADCPARRTLQDGLVHEVTRQRTSAGVVRSHRALSSPVFGPGGEVTGAIEMIEDVTEKLALELQLQQAQKMESVGRLAGGVAHDFNNMLGVILGHAEMALEQTDPGGPLHADLAEIQKAAERSAELTRQLLGFARKQTVMPRVLDLNEAVAGMLKMLERLIGEDIYLDFQPGVELWPVNVDPSQVGQVLANLCVNARDAIAGVGRVAIVTRNSTLDHDYCAAHAGAVCGEYVELAVSDDGCGLSQQTMAQLFEPFFTTKGVGEGTGLGLATVYGIVKQNKGFIEVESKLDEGSTFSIYLPRHEVRAGQGENESVPTPVARGQETILLVEDEPAILRLAAKMLERQGYTVVAAGTPGEAIRLAREHAGDIDLLVTDVVMPEMNGRELAKNLLSLHPHIRRLFMSGYTSDVIAHQGALEEGMHFIQKPFSSQELAVQVRLALDE